MNWTQIHLLTGNTYMAASLASDKWVAPFCMALLFFAIGLLCAYDEWGDK